MGKETENILELLEQWQKYITEHEADINLFGKWLSEQPRNSELQPNKEDSNKPFREQYIHDAVPLEDQIVLHWGRLQRFTHLWSRKALNNLPIHSMEEFGLIKSLELLGSARKSDLARYSLIETSTCFEMIKRLVKAGYLQEEVDPEDRRSRKVRLTEKGKSLSIESEQHVRQLARLLIGNINTEQKQVLLEILRDLDDFHGKLYSHNADTSLSEIIVRINGKR